MKKYPKVEDDWKLNDSEMKCPFCDKILKIRGFPSHWYRIHSDKEYDFSSHSWNRGLRNDIRCKHTEETKKKISLNNTGKAGTDAAEIIRKEKISVARKKYLFENPDKHPWKKKDKFISEPCEKLKERLLNENILFEEEFQPLEDRFFSIDIFIPSKNIGIEVNGNQHYNKDGSLRTYYQKRHDLIEESGIRLIDWIALLQCL